MTETCTQNFDWLLTASAKTEIAQSLVNCCKKAKPKWTKELDAAARIIFFAVNGGLAHRKYNEMYLRKINDLLDQGILCNSDVIDIAIEILENQYFQIHADTTKLITQQHIELVCQFATQWDKNRWNTKYPQQTQ